MVEIDAELGVLFIKLLKNTIQMLLGNRSILCITKLIKGTSHSNDDIGFSAMLQIRGRSKTN